MIELVLTLLEWKLTREAYLEELNDDTQRGMHRAARLRSHLNRVEEDLARQLGEGQDYSRFTQMLEKLREHRQG